MEKKNQLIKSLFDQGKITFEQALLLASQQESAVENLMYQDTNGDEFLSTTIQHIYEDLVEIGETRINVEYIVKIMNERNWTWKDEPVTVAKFKSLAFDLIKQVVTHLYEVCKENQNRDKDEDYSVYTGGIRVSGLLNTDDVLTVILEFVFDSSSTDYDL